MKLWSIIIDEWINKHVSYREYRNEITDLFRLAMMNTMLPERSWFGYPPSMNSLNIIFGQIYLIGIFDRTIEIVVDEDLSSKVNYKTRLVGTSKSGGLNLYWISANLNQIHDLISNDKIWQHYRLASLKVNSSNAIRRERRDWLEGKFPVRDVFDGEQLLFDDVSLEQFFEAEMMKSVVDTDENRFERLKQAIKKPTVVSISTKAFIRNPDVVVEVLKRADNICEYCNCLAPFVSDSTRGGYLEVHHVVPLSENGDDTVENAVALCPNCHRHAHFGKSSFETERLLLKIKNTLSS